MPVFKAVPEIAPPADFRVAGRRSHASRTLQRAHGDVAHIERARAATARGSRFPLSLSRWKAILGSRRRRSIPRFWAPGWNSVQALNKFQSEVGGPLRGGDPGRASDRAGSSRKGIVLRRGATRLQPRDGGWLIIPVYHIFGSEELSVLAPAIAERAPQPYLAMNPDDADPPAGA